MPTVNDDPTPLIALPDQDAGRFSDDGLHYAETAGGQATWSLVAVGNPSGSSAGGNFHVDRPDDDRTWVPLAADIGEGSLEDNQEIVAKLTDGTRLKFIVESGVAVLKDTVEPVGSGVGSVVEGTEGGPAPGAASCRYTINQTGEAAPAVTFTPGTAEYQLDVTGGLVLSADFFVLPADIVNGAIAIVFSGPGFTGNINTRYPTRVEAIASPSNNGFYASSHAVQTGPTAGGAYDKYRITGLVNGAEYKILVNF